MVLGKVFFIFKVVLVFIIVVVFDDELAVCGYVVFD